MNNDQSTSIDSALPLTRRNFALLSGALGAAGLIGAVPGTALAAVPSSIRPGPSGPHQPPRTTAQSLGVNATGYDARLADPEIPGLLRQAGIGLIRYPGGGNADSFDWRTGGPITWPLFLQISGQAGAAPLITVNYGQAALGPEQAGAWAADAVQRPGWDSDTALWVIGNEGYGPWERDEHPDPHTPDSYAVHVRDYMQAIHRSDPRARVGFPMSIDRNVAGGTGTWVPDPDRWNRTVLSRNRDQVDWIDFHWYPVFGIPVLSNAQIFETVQRIPGALAYLTGVIKDAGADVPIFVSESNISQSEVVYNAQPVAALYASATALTFLAHGAHSFLWWQVHNTDNMNGDFGFLSDGTGSPGPSATTLTSAAKAGDVHLDVVSTDGFYYGHRFTVGAGGQQESHKITAIGGSATLSADAAPRSRTIKVSSVVPFAAGSEITIGSGTTAERRSVTAVGTAAGTTQLAAPARAGDRRVRIVGEGMGGQSIAVFMPISLAPGARIVISSGTDTETAVIDTVGTSSSLGTTTVAPAHPGDKIVYVTSVANSNTGIANYVGDLITVGTGDQVETAVIRAVGTSAATTPTTLAANATRGDRAVQLTTATTVTQGHALTIGAGDQAEQVIVASVASPSASGTTVHLSAPLRQNHAQGDPALDLGTGITLDSPLRLAHPTGTATRDAGSGITLTRPLRRSHPEGTTVTTSGTGVTLSAPLTHSHPTGDAVAGTGITFTPPLRAAHPAGTAVGETGLKEPAPNTPMPAYWGYVLTSLLTQPGAEITQLTSPSPTVLAFQSLRPGTTSVMLINTDDARSATARLTGLKTAQAITAHRYGLENPTVTLDTTRPDQVEAGLDLAPESITVLVADTGRKNAQRPGELSLDLRTATS